MQDWIVIVAPHQDDEVLGCGGTIYRLSKVNHYNVAVIYLTDGQGETAHVRREEAKTAGKLLGIKEQLFLGYSERDLGFNRDILERLIQSLRKYNPLGVFAPHPNERDRDHRIACEVVREAVMLSCNPGFIELGKATGVPRLMFYEVWTPLTRIHYQENITPNIAIKRQALEAYASQFHADVVPALVGLNAYRNALHNRLAYTEAFQFND